MRTWVDDRDGTEWTIEVAPSEKVLAPGELAPRIDRVLWGIRFQRPGVTLLGWIDSRVGLNLGHLKDAELQQLLDDAKLSLR